jgi:methylated-DNA-[protein]-cysteine S-methyltransferase
VNQINVKYHKTDIGEMVLGSLRGRLCLLGSGSDGRTGTLNPRFEKRLDARFVVQADETLEITTRQLDEYLRGTRDEFDIPLLLVGTDFQRSVWNALLGVPYGATASYLQIALAIGKEKAVRAVGNACRANPIGIIVPCHRIIGSDGSLVGYYGGLSLKQRLLNLERSNSSIFRG